jgi:hypothetical protein
MNQSNLEKDLNLTNDQYLLWDLFIHDIQIFYRDSTLQISAQIISVDNSATLKFIQSGVNDYRNKYTAIENLEGAAKKLYLKLNKDQKEIFDTKGILIIPYRIPKTNY